MRRQGDNPGRLGPISAKAAEFNMTGRALALRGFGLGRRKMGDATLVATRNSRQQMMHCSIGSIKDFVE
ncbi:MAG: hypothetical protein A3G25_01945 [Betaproteobacteria bacterium RIFCSPLOWO2_12_FULL_63_13]|nr:MAG: hypothetical protein A3H32_15185 [Betaproteobacteria bacterium RIFCSPLOWO2_02_FULL_63_19]OGA49705.1 MAG: hypothetical protein A3G25_01945 [Betaproteobacteria bacterium RIFCSPLOWO2_12_FULL_63_13]